MKALAIIDAEIAWREAQAESMRRPVESLALACAIGAIRSLNNVRTAIADRSAPAPRRETGVARKGESGGAVQAIAQGQVMNP